MNEPELKVKIGEDEKGNPIYKDVKKIIFFHIDENRVMTKHKARPFFNGQIWMFKAHKRLFTLDKDSIFFDKKLNFYVLGFNESDKK